MGPTDGELVRQASAGDVSAFDSLVDRYYADCLRHAYHMLGDRADAEEVVQDTFVRAFRALDRYQERDRFRAWLFSILANRCRSRGARAQRRWSLLRRYSEGGDENEDDADREVENAEIYDRIRRALEQLPASQRQAFLLRHVEEMSYDEISRITGAGISALKMRVKRAREQLAQLLSELDE